MPEDPKPIRTWRQIADEASHEHDSAKLAQLSKELEAALDEQTSKLRPRPADTQAKRNTG